MRPRAQDKLTHIAPSSEIYSPGTENDLFCLVRSLALSVLRLPFTVVMTHTPVLLARPMALFTFGRAELEDAALLRTLLTEMVSCNT